MRLANLRANPEPRRKPRDGVDLDRARNRAKRARARLRRAEFQPEMSGRYHGMRRPRDLGQGEVEPFLAHLANERHVSVSTRRARSAASPSNLRRRAPGRQIAEQAATIKHPELAKLNVSPHLVRHSTAMGLLQALHSASWMAQ